MVYNLTNANQSTIMLLLKSKIFQIVGENETKEFSF